MLREDISKGQRMEAFTVEALTADGWKEIAKGTTVGYKRLIRIPAVEARQLRVKVDACRLAANISEVAAYYARPLEESAAKENWNDLPRTAWKQVTATPLVIDLGKAVDMTGFVYAPANAEAKPTMVTSVINSISALMAETGKRCRLPENSVTSCTILYRRLSRSVTKSVHATLNLMLPLRMLRRAG